LGFDRPSPAERRADHPLASLCDNLATIQLGSMNKQTEKRLLLTDMLLAFATELRQLLEEQGESELAVQVSGLMIFDRCRCGDDICATFYS
jgi:hypothetical protein